MRGWRQLWFGYADSGLEGRDREQVVACTPGLLDDPAVEAVARRLCRHDPDDSPTTGSFGWIDEDELRFVFCRTPVPSGDGTSITLAAHVLVGPRADATAARVLGLFDSPSWWRGEPLDPTLRAAGGALPETGLDDFEPASADAPAGDAPHPDLLASLAEAVLADAGLRPVLLPHDSRIAVATMTALARQVPALAELVSFSSQEPGPTQHWFDVVGWAGAGAHGDASTVEPPPDRRGGPHLASGRLADVQTMVSAVVPLIVGRHDEVDRAQRDVFLHAVDALVRRDLAGIDWLLDDPRSRLLLISSPTGRAVAAESLWGRVRPRWVQGSQALSGCSAQLRELGALTWRSRPPDVTTEQINDAWTELAALGSDAADGLVRAFMTEALAGDLVGVDPPGRLLAASLRTALEASVSPDVMGRLVGLAAAHVDADLLTSPIVPVGWRVRCAVTALRRSTLSPEALGTAAALDAPLAQQLLADDIDDDAVDAILAAVPPEQAAVLVAGAIHRVGHRRAMRSLREVGRSLGSARILTVLAALTTVVDLGLDEDDERWVAGHFACAVDTGVHDSQHADPVLDVPWELAKRLTAPGCDHWRQAALLVRPRTDHAREVTLERFALLLDQVDHGPTRRVVALLGIDTSLLAVQQADQVAEVIDLLGTRQGLEAGDLISLLLTRAERLVEGPGRSLLGPLLIHLASTWVVRPRLHLRASLPDGHQARAETLAARIGDREWRGLLRAGGGYGSTGSGWLRGLAGGGPI